MKNPSLFRRILSMVLVFAMLASLLVPVASAEPAKRTGKQVEELTLTPIDPGTLQSHKLGQTSGETPITREEHALTDMVRVTIMLEKPSTLEAGFSTVSIADNAEAKSYRAGLRAEQDAVTAKIEQKLGGKLNVKWNLTLAANFISADVLYGQIDAIKGIDGVKDVFLETRYEPQTNEKGDEPNNGAAAHMIGSNITWAAGLTGAGSRLAVIDTGTDTAHQSFSGEALEYALRQNAEEKGMSYEAYVKSLNLLTAAEIDAVKDQLNVSVSSGRAYINTKLPFNYSYVDSDYDVTHENDEQGEHGSHVAGISTANRFIKVGNEFQPALEVVGTQGVAPDAQLLTMKVFGNGGGAYSSDYMAAIEDAIVLGCDSANLSLGSAAPGFGFDDNDKYEAILNGLVEHGMVCTISMGNSGMWYDEPKNENMHPYLYADDASFYTGGSPGSYTNALTVASSDNAGQIGKPLLFGERHVFYTENTDNGNAPISTLAGSDLEYVLIDGVGVDKLDPNNPDEDANNNIGTQADQFFQLGSEVLAGKIAICYRGTSSFFVKANAAMAQGAIGIIIINNVPGTINMILKDYAYTAPAVSILKTDGDAIKASSAAVTDDAGNVRYYTGTFSVGEELEIYVPALSDTVGISFFSSYGVPGTLTLKPEILAPGGSIYSVFGYNLVDEQKREYTGGHDQYELMSGTSMAAPQINGMAGIMAQYIRENDLCKKTGLSQRQLINSLLMSTAYPVFDEYGDYWPTLRVGAGHANVADAVAAQSYIMMDEGATLFPDSAKDGKIKVELGDDPDYIGKYDFAFTLTPFEGQKAFTLRTDIFTQAIAGDGGYGMLQDTATMLIGAETTYEINGETYENVYRVDADVNLDGEINGADVQAILDHISGEEKEGAKFDAEAADADGDGKISTYDAKLLLDSAESPIIEVSEPTKISVHIELDQDEIAELRDYFTKGFYVEGYTYVDPVADAEGVLDVVHSIPILGFCGSWTEPSMFDRTSAIDEAYGTAKRPYIGNSKINYMTVRDEEGATNIYMGNPYTVEEEFPADRLAMKSNASIASYTYLNIRNAATLGFAVQDEAGKVLFSQAQGGRKGSAFYNVNAEIWQNTSPTIYPVGKRIGSVGVKEGDKITIGFYALPEYVAIALAKRNDEIAKSGFLDNAGFTAALENGLVSDGAAIKYTVTVDDTAPVIKGAMRDLISGDFTVRASDNHYIAYVAVMNKSGTREYTSAVPAQSAPGEELEIPVQMNGQRLPKEVVLLVGDYAGNETAVLVNLDSKQDEDLTGAAFAFTSGSAAPGSGNRMLEIDAAKLTYDSKEETFTGLSVVTPLPFAVEAAEYVDGYIFMAAADNSHFYVMPIDDMGEVSVIGSFGLYTSVVYDMAFNYQDEQLYVLGENNTLYTMDLLTGALTRAAEISITNPKNAEKVTLKGLAIDGAGNFYAANAADGNEVFLYSFNLAMRDGAGRIDNLAPVNNSADGTMGVYNSAWGGSMAWDHNSNQLYMISNYVASGAMVTYNSNANTGNGLCVVDVTTGKAARANEAGAAETSAVLYNACSGLIIVPARKGIVNLTDTVDSLLVMPMEMTLFKGQTGVLTPYLTPWTLKDKSLTWTSADEKVATVADGVVTGVEIGETTITVVTNAKPNLSFEIPVSVVEVPEAELRGIIWDADGKGMTSVFNSNDTQNWEGLAEVGQLRWGVLVDDQVYGSTDSTMFAYDADTYEVKKLGVIVSDWMPSDAAALPADIASALGTSGRVVGLCNNGKYLEFLNPESGTLNYVDMSKTFAEDPMALIAYGTRLGVAATYYVLTESGELWTIVLSPEVGVSTFHIGPTKIVLDGVADVTNTIWGSMVYNEENNFLYVSLYDGSDDCAHLYAIDARQTNRNKHLGDFKEKVYPVVGLYEYEPLTDLALKLSSTSVSTYETETVQVNIRVKLGETNKYTTAVADPTICSIDENGVITGLKAGETTITVTTVDLNDAGERVSEQIHVTVRALKRVDASIFAQITDGNGARFTEIDLNSALASDAGTQAPGSISTGARGGELYLIGMETSEGAVAQVLDAQTLQPTDVWNGVNAEYYAKFPAQDMASYPRLVDEEGNVLNDYRFVFTTAETDGVLADTDYYGWKTQIDDMAGVCLWNCKYEDNAHKRVTYEYLLMTTAGVLYNLEIDPDTGELYSYILLETGITFDKQSDCSMTVVFDEGKGIHGLVVANEGTKKLYYIDFKASAAEEAVCFVGTLDVENVSGLAGTIDALYNEVEIVRNDNPGPGPGPGPGPNPSGEQYFSFNFEERDGEGELITPEQAGFTLFDADGDGYNWEYSNYGEGRGESIGCMSSDSYHNANGVALNADNWVFTPAINLSGATNPELSIYVKDGGWFENFQLCAGTAPNPESMTVSRPLAAAPSDWQEIILDLSALAGQSEVYVGIRHKDTDKYRMYIDEITVQEAASGGSSEESLKLPELGTAFQHFGHGIARMDIPASAAVVQKTRLGETANETSGSTNAVRGERSIGTLNDTRKPVCVDPIAGNGKVSIDLSDDEATTNGLYVLTYDAEALTYVNTVSKLSYISVHNEVEGKVGTLTVAYASRRVIEAEHVIAMLNFSYAGEIDTEITIETVERNDNVAVKEEPLVISLTEHVCPCAHFTDMPEYGTVEHAAIDWAFTHDPQITNGMDETTFRPDVIVNRGQAVTFLWRAKEKPEPANTENPFTDVEEGRFFYDAVLWAVNCDPQITNGVTETTFAPFKTCNRAEILTFLWRTMGRPEPEGECPYSDVPAERYFAKAATWAYENGIYRGADGLFQPTEGCTRSDVVVFLYRYFTHRGLAE